MIKHLLIFVSFFLIHNISNSQGDCSNEIFIPEWNLTICKDDVDWGIDTTDPRSLIISSNNLQAKVYVNSVNPVITAKEHFKRRYGIIDFKEITNESSENSLTFYSKSYEIRQGFIFVVAVERKNNYFIDYVITESIIENSSNSSKFLDDLRQQIRFNPKELKIKDYLFEEKFINSFKKLLSKKKYIKKKILLEETIITNCNDSNIKELFEDDYAKKEFIDNCKSNLEEVEAKYLDNKKTDVSYISMTRFYVFQGIKLYYGSVTLISDEQETNLKFKALNVDNVIYLVGIEKKDGN